MSKVRTRFAPSPTGFLHIGGARTALFNWLYAKHHGGEMLLRIEDTDRERSTQEAVDAIIEGLKWLELDWAGEPISQFARVERHREIVHRLLESGHAYYCQCTPEELAEMREKARAEGRPMTYDRRCRELGLCPPHDKPLVVRFAAPREGEIVIHDMVQGEVRWQAEAMDDLVLMRADGTPTYNLAVVVDDHDMGITHVIRGVDHLTNAARQKMIYDALGWEMPKMAHIPLIHGPDGAKLSKRHGALGVEAYRAMGYLPEAMRNYLARLGWSHGDDEIFTTEQLIEWFDVDAIGKSPARFDFVKLESVNGWWIRNLDDERLLARFEQFLPHADKDHRTRAELARRLLEQPEGRQRFLKALPGLKERAKTLVELLDLSYYLYAERPLEIAPKAAKILDKGGRDVLRDLLPVLEAINEAGWTEETLEERIKAFAEAQELKLGKVAQPLRAALTGSNVSPGIFEVLAVLGREESLARIRDQLA
ncbi:glutamate--tRNA ligase [Thermopetrobacter sp. TC1]|uniref:glutamate--tRNA ligase n=1 Tax=Thermopetrobacter sp. TC1 TaxID=1495045 RepID=UPI00056EBD3A|nr:glutamate--tRNA ligase [Thermopetrobacter sp. TC1]